MKLLNEPISTWISIAAFLISLSTLILAFRKQRHDERVMLASKIKEIKALQAEMIRVIDEILEKDKGLEDFIKKSLPADQIPEHTEMIKKDREGWQNLRSQIETRYSRLGHKSLKTTDPVVLSAVAVESEDIKRDLERAKSKVEVMADDLKTIIKNKSQTRKLSSLRTNRKKPLKTQNKNKKSEKTSAKAG